MALLDVSEVLSDPIFYEPVSLIRRSSSVNGYGENVLAEKTVVISAVVQPASNQDLKLLPEAAQSSGAIVVYSRVKQESESNLGYSDVILWGSLRYQVLSVENYSNWGTGYTKAIATQEAVSK